MSAGAEDAVVLVAADRKKATCAVRQVVKRAEMAFLGVPEETRKMLEEGSSAYMRPLPGAARMYPETDVLPVLITAEVWDQIPVPELISARAERFHRDLSLDAALARQIAYSERLPLFERAIDEGLKPTLTARTLLSTLKELSRDGVAIDRIGDDQVLAVLHSIEEGKAAKEAIGDLLRAVADGTCRACFKDSGRTEGFCRRAGDGCSRSADGDCDGAGPGIGGRKGRQRPPP